MPLPNSATPIIQQLSEVISGSVGFVILPDSDSIGIAYDLASQLMPRDAEFILSPGSLPHLTLYHSKLNGFPVDLARVQLADLRKALTGLRFNLDNLEIFGDNFLFWNVNCSPTEHSSDNLKLLFDAHRIALKAADFRDSSAEAKAIKDEKLSLSNEELQNIANFGHPLVLNRYTPHITLGFHPNLISRLSQIPARHHEFQVASVELVTIGHPGRVEGIIQLPNKP
jgi:hypothetical protein